MVANEFPNAIIGNDADGAPVIQRALSGAVRIGLTARILGKLLKSWFVGVAAVLVCCATAAHATELDDFKLLKFGNTGVRWRNVTPGQAPMVSYGIVA